MHIQERDVRLEHIYKLSVLEARNTTKQSGSDETLGDIQYLHDPLLLARGGHSVYAGKRFQSQYFLASIVPKPQLKPHLPQI